MVKTLPLLLFPLGLATIHTSAHVQAQQVIIAEEVSQTSSKKQIIEKKASQVMDWLAEGNYSQVMASLHPDLQSKWPPQKIETAWQDLLSKTGPFKQHGKARVIPYLDGNIVNIRATFENTKDHFLFIFNQDQQIVGIDFPKTESIEEIAEKVVDALAANDFATARGYLHPKLKQEIFPQKAQEAWQRLLTITGPFKQRGGTEIRPGSTFDNVDLVLVTIEFEKVTEPLFVIFDHDKRIVNIDFPNVLEK